MTTKQSSLLDSSESDCAGTDMRSNTSHLSDEYLVRRVIEGRTQHFALLVERYQHKLHALVLGITGYRYVSESEDIVQNIFIKIFHKLDQFKFQSSFSSWLYRVAYNSTHDHLRRLGSYQSALSKEAKLDPEYVDQSIDDDGLQKGLDHEFCETLDRLIKTLPKTTVIAIRCYYWLDRPLAEIAEILDTKENNVKSILHRARKTLMSLLENENE